MTRFQLFAFFLSSFVATLASGPAFAQPAAAPLVLEVLPDASELDAAALRAGVSTELQAPVVAPDDARAQSAGATLTVGIDRGTNELFVELRRPGAYPLTRRVPRPADAALAQRTVVFLAGNMVRNESQAVLRELSVALRPAPPLATHPVEAAAPPAAPPSPARKRFWLAIGIEGALGAAPSASDACLLTPEGYETSGYYCTSGGRDFPSSSAQNSAIQQGVADRVAGGAAFLSPRIALSFDYAPSDNLLVGARVGISLGPRYDGSAAKTWGPTHLELRATYVAGDRALARKGLHPAYTVGLGMAEWDENVPVTFFEGTSSRSADAWRIVAGPFVSGAVGLRYAFSRGLALRADVAKLTLVSGLVSASPASLLFTPALEMEVGF